LKREVLANYSQISYEEFRRLAIDAGCRAISALCYRPGQDETASRFTISVGQLLSGRTYSVRSSNVERTSFVAYDDPSALALRFDDLVRSPILLNEIFKENNQYARVQIAEFSVTTLLCSGCGHRIVVDGNHRLARVADEGKSELIVSVVELSGRDWPAETPDFNVVCDCPRVTI
jgi:hypothetical protein